MIRMIVSVGADRSLLGPELGGLLLDAELAVDVRIAHSAEQAYALAAGSEGVERVVALGGDGTLGAVAGGLREIVSAERPVLGIVPMGTANDFAKSTGFSALPVREALRNALIADASPIDAGIVRRANGQATTFLNMLTVGFPAELSTTTPRPLKDAVGGLAYALHGLANLELWQPKHMEIRAPGREWSGKAMAVCVCNGKAAGGGNPVAPDAEIDDGLFDVVLVPELTAAELIPTALASRVDPHARPESVETWRVPWVEIRAMQPLPTTADGEPADRMWMRAEIDPGAVRLAGWL
ncbi:MAG: YegS/Rv2252/BmrU family lipid kinase [Deltaproteobacteria bacterium]|nr:MAG: YegS/Rv2252/BmrU family lipid kinase [Deltaproteobacteria bacterium]